MEMVDYTLRLEKEMFERIQSEAAKRHINLADAFRVTIACGLPALSSSLGTEEAGADTWEKLGPAPEVDYDQL